MPEAAKSADDIEDFLTQITRNEFKDGELRSLYEHLQARILELIETLDEVRASADYAIYQVAEQDAAVIERIAGEQRTELVKEIEALKVDAERKAAEARELAGEVPF